MRATGSRSRQTLGFTLVELMVVLVIIGLAASAVLLATPDSGGLRREAERFAARASAARDGAILNSRPYGLAVDAGGYAVTARGARSVRYDWDEGTVSDTVGATRFDSTGLAEPLGLTLRRGEQHIAIEIGHDGAIAIRR